MPVETRRPEGTDGDQLGRGRLITAESILDALRLARAGQVFDLDAGRFRNMPRHYATPPFEVMTYRSPAGEQTEGDLDFLRPDVNKVNLGFVSELVMGTMHVGAHIDALCHVTYGKRAEFYGGFSAYEHVGDHGATKCDVSKIPPIVARGVLVDVAGLKAVDTLPESYPITGADIEDACEAQGVEIRSGDVVLVRTGQMNGWPHTGRPGNREAGLSLDGARYLTEQEILAVAVDNSAMEVSPSIAEGNPQPVHIHVLAQEGVYVLEWIFMEELREAHPSEFLFICLPLKIEGATGSWIRPVAIA
jgi:kynurenine formamidase